MHSWPVLVSISLLALVTAYLLTHFSSSQLQKSRSFILILTSYGIITSMIMIFFISIWHFHPIWGEWIHFHPNQQFTEIIIIQTGIIYIDLFSILVLFSTALFYLIATLYSQYKLNKLLKNLLIHENQDLTQNIRGRHHFTKSTDVRVINDSEPAAFSFSTIDFKRGFRVRDTLILSSKLLDILNKDELSTVIAHEYAHCTNQDTRYAHLVVSLGALLRFDPILRFLRKRLDRQQELAADDLAVEITNKPRFLASALFKLMEFRFNENSYTSSFMSGSKELLFYRINRLLEMS